MGFCEKIKADRVLADEIFYLQKTLGPVDIGFSVPEDSILTGTVEITVLECDLDFDEEEDLIRVLIEIMVQKEFTINTDDRELPLEFAFRNTLETQFAGITPSLLEELGIEFRRVKCQIFDIKEITDEIIFLCGDEEENATIEETILIPIKLKLAIEEQLIVALCPASHRRIIDVEVSCE